MSLISNLQFTGSARTTISLSNFYATDVVNLSQYDAGEIAGWVYINAATKYRFWFSAKFAKNGAGTDYWISPSTMGDAPPAGFSISITSSGLVKVFMPSISGFISASITYALDAPAVGASFPLNVDSTSLNIVDSAPLSYRNRIINGGMDVWQRGTTNSLTAAIASAGAYTTADRWKTLAVISGQGTYHTDNRRSTDAPDGFKYSMQIGNHYGTTDSLGVLQPIESENCYDIRNSATLSLYLKKGASATFGRTIVVSVLQPKIQDTHDNFLNLASTYYDTLATVSLNLDNYTSWSRVALPVSGITSAASRGLAVRIHIDSTDMAAGTDWFKFTGVQLEVGSKASAFERRPYGMELQLCQRYFQNANYGSLWYTSGTGVFVDMEDRAMGGPQFFVPMRTTPAVYITADNGATQSIKSYGNDPLRTVTGISATIYGVASVSHSGTYTLGRSYTATWKAEAEL